MWEVRQEALWDSWPDSMALHVGPKSCEGKGQPESWAAPQMQSRRLVLGRACPRRVRGWVQPCPLCSSLEAFSLCPSST